MNERIERIDGPEGDFRYINHLRDHLCFFYNLGRRATTLDSDCGATDGRNRATHHERAYTRSTHKGVSVFWRFHGNVSATGGLFGILQTSQLATVRFMAGYLGELITTWTFGWLGLFMLGLPLSWPNVIFVCCGFVVCAIGDLIGSGAKRELGVKHSNEYLIDVPFLGRIECLMRSRHGFLDCMDSASCALIFYIILQQLGRF